MGRLLTSCLPSASVPAESAAVSTSQSLRQSDAGQRMIRCLLTCAQYGTCVCSVGLITGFGHSPTPGQLQRRQGRSALCLFARKIGSVSIFLAPVHMREHSNCQPALASAHIKVVFLRFSLSQKPAAEPELVS